MRSADRCDFEALRSRQGQAEAILVAYDIMEADGQDVRPEALEERRNRLAKLLTPETKRCETASDSVRRSPETGPPSFGMPAPWTSKALSRSASARVTLAARLGPG